MNFFILNELTGVENGPYTLTQIQDLIKKGKLKKSALVRKSDSAQYQKAGVLLAKLYDRVEAELEHEKEQAKAVRDEAKKSQAQQLAFAREQKAAEKSAFQKDEQQRNQISNDRNRGSFFSRVLGSPSPSPYWGFEVQGRIINVLIVLMLGLAVLGCLGSLTLGVIGQFVGSLTISERLGLFLFSLLQVVGLMLSTFFIVALLIFYRNLIDWMIDMENHAHAIRQRLLKED